MGITSKLIDIAKGGKQNWPNFLSEWTNKIDPHDSLLYEAETTNARIAFNALTNQEKADVASQNILKPTGVGTGGFINRAMATQYAPTTMNLPEFGTIEGGEKIIGGLVDIFSGRWGAGLKKIGSILQGEVLLYLSQTNKLYREINEKAMMTGELAEAFRGEIMEASPWITKLGIGFEEFSESVGNLVANSGKFKLLNEDTMKDMALASKFTESMGAFVNMGKDFERIGLCVRDMSTLIEKMAMRSLALGLNGKTTVAMVAENLKKINQYGFKDGVDGLARMAQKSVEFRMNMQNVFTLAENVWSPDKALDIVANLQVIGGAFGDLNDPIKLMYMATNNVEGLQDAIIGATRSLVTYNEEQGRFQVTGVQLRQAKAMADELGMSLEELSDTAIAQAERTEAAYDLSGLSFNIPEKEIEFLTNLARMEGGKMIIDIPKTLRDDLKMNNDQTSLALDSMTQEQKEIIIDQQELLTKMDPKDIPRQQVMALENIQRDMSALRGYMRVTIGHNAADIVEKALGIDGDLVKKLSEGLSGIGMKQIEGFDKYAEESIKQWDGLVNIGEMASNWVDNLNKTNESKEEKQRGEVNTGANSMNVVAAEKLGRSENPVTPSSTVERKIIDINIVPTSASMDRIAQIFWGDPRWQANLKDSFINPN